MLAQASSYSSVPIKRQRPAKLLGLKQRRQGQSRPSIQVIKFTDTALDSGKLPCFVGLAG